MQNWQVEGTPLCKLPLPAGSEDTGQREKRRNENPLKRKSAQTRKHRNWKREPRQRHRTPHRERRGNRNSPCATGTPILTKNAPPQQEKHSTVYWLSAFGCVGVYLSSRAAAGRVLSAQVSLTAVFGMGTGVPSPPSTPTGSEQIP